MEKYLELPGPVNSYESKERAYEALRNYRQQAAELLGITTDELHEMGPIVAEIELGKLGVEIISHK